MITTQQTRIPWSWTIALALPAGSAMFVEQCSTTALAFTLKRFVSDPVLIVFIGSINVAFNFLVAPYAAWKSDHTWTRWGRRIPFFVAGWSVMALALMATPFAPSIWVLALCVLVWQFGMDWGYTGTWEPLYYEIIPRPQRGRSVAIKRVAMLSARIIFNLVLLGRFDQVCSMNAGMAMPGNTTLALRGEHLIYLSAGFLTLACALGALFSIKESPPQSPITATTTSRRHFGQFAKDILGNRQWWPLYLLAFCAVALTANLGVLQPLLVTEQFGYSKRMLGRIEAIAMIPEIVIVLPLVFLIADRWSRLLLFRLGLVACTLHPLAYWMFVKYLAPGQIPTSTQIIVFEVLGHVARMAACLTFEPLLFDLAPCAKLGTVYAGFLFVRGLVTLLVANGLGFWVKLWSAFFAGPNRFDYMSGYLYLAAVGAVGCLVAAYATRRDRLPTAQGHSTNKPPFSDNQQPATFCSADVATPACVTGCK